jgi:ATP-dependent phosphoenolpyruvate carboxykinase
MHNRVIWVILTWPMAPQFAISSLRPGYLKQLLKEMGMLTDAGALAIDTEIFTVRSPKDRLLWMTTSAMTTSVGAQSNLKLTAYDFYPVPKNHGLPESERGVCL